MVIVNEEEAVRSGKDTIEMEARSSLKVRAAG